MLGSSTQQRFYRSVKLLLTYLFIFFCLNLQPQHGGGAEKYGSFVERTKEKCHPWNCHPVFCLSAAAAERRDG